MRVRSLSFMSLALTLTLTACPLVAGYSAPAAPPKVAPGTAKITKWAGGPVSDPFQQLEDWPDSVRLPWLKQQRDYTTAVLKESPDYDRWIAQYMVHLSYSSAQSGLASRGGADWWVTATRDDRYEVRTATPWTDPTSGTVVWTSEKGEGTGKYAVDLISPSPDGSACVVRFDPWSDHVRPVLVTLNAALGEVGTTTTEIDRPITWLPYGDRFWIEEEYSPLQIGCRISEVSVLPTGITNREVLPDVRKRLLPTPTRSRYLLFAKLDEQGVAEVMSTAYGPEGSLVNLLWRESGEIVSTDVQLESDGTEILYALVRDRLAGRHKVVRVPMDGSAKAERWLDDLTERPRFLCAGRDHLGIMVEGWKGWRWELYRWDGTLAKTTPLPVVESIVGDPFITDDGLLRVGVSGIAAAPRILEFDPDTGTKSSKGTATTEHHSIAPEVKFLEIPATDGVMIRARIVGTHTALAKTGQVPTLVYVYGGFDLTTDLDNGNVLEPWVAAGGLWVSAEVRGSGDRDRRWYADGLGEGKRQSVRDVVSVVNYLIAEGYTDAAHIAVMGASHGGWLAAMAGLTAPESIQAVISLAPLTDLVRMQEMRVWMGWVDEWGDPRRSSDQPRLLDLSPYHLAGRVDNPPAFYIGVADDDTRLESWNAYKLTARLQHGDPARPTLCYPNETGGHGMAGDDYESAMLEPYILIFAGWQLGLAPDR